MDSADEAKKGQGWRARSIENPFSIEIHDQALLSHRVTHGKINKNLQFSKLFFGQSPAERAPLLHESEIRRAL